MTDLATRYLGTCIVCERQIKVRDGFLVHHGYKRPGDGYIYGDCFGVGYWPHEVAIELAEAYLKTLENTIPFKEKTLVSSKEKLVALEEELKKLYAAGLLRYSADADPYKNEIYKTNKSAGLLEHEIKMMKLDVERMKKHIASWSLKPLVTFEEEIQKQALKKAEAAQARADKKRAKVDAAVKRFQERIDSAYKRKNKNALANLYESICRKLYDIDNTLNKQERLRLVDRENVWMELGVFKDGSYYEDYSLARDIITNSKPAILYTTNPVATIEELRASDVPRGFDSDDLVARRAKNSSGSLDAYSLPTYDQIAGWLGAEWVMCHGHGRGYAWTPIPADFGPGSPHHSPWWFEKSDSSYRCYLKHTSGQRVEVTAPKEAMSAENWEFWFIRIARAPGWIPHTYESFVRWLDPDTMTSSGSEPRWHTKDPMKDK